MIDVNDLIGKDDIFDINITQYFSDHMEIDIDIKFMWEEDCGCFSVKKTSCLSLNFDSLLLQRVIDNMTNHKGIIGAYILNHKEYTGKLLEIEEDDLID